MLVSGVILYDNDGSDVHIVGALGPLVSEIEFVYILFVQPGPKILFHLLNVLPGRQSV